MTYKEDVNNCIKNEIKQFLEYLAICRPSVKNNVYFSMVELWIWFNENGLIDVFLN